MKPAASPLNILDFAITNFEFGFNPPDTELDVNIKELFSRYDIDIDFGIHGNDIIQVFMKAHVNHNEKLPGYTINAEATCIFEFDEQHTISAEQKSSIGGYSTIYIALNTLRGFISQITANGPWGRYILPSIDLNDLVEKKKLQLQSNNPKNEMPKEKKKSSVKRK